QQSSEVYESQVRLLRFQVRTPAQLRESVPEEHVAVFHLGAAGDPEVLFPRRLEPGAHGANRGLCVIGMRLDILAGDVRTKTVIAVRVAVEDQAGLPALAGVPEPLGPQENAELQRHVKPGEPGLPVQAGAGKVVNAVLAGGKEPVDFLEPVLTTVVNLQ